MKTNGISPKVSLPALTLVGIGVALVVIGYLIGDDTLPTLGYGAIGSGITGAAVGAAAAPGDVVPAIPAAKQVDPAAGDVKKE